MPSTYYEHFALFETIDNTFERKLSPDECPFAIYVANFSTASATCLLLKPFVFSKCELEKLTTDLNMLDLIFHQAVLDVDQGRIKATSVIGKLKYLEDSGKKLEVSQLLRVHSICTACKLQGIPWKGRFANCNCCERD